MRDLIKKLNKYGNSFRAFEPNIARVLVGIFIFYKGATFLQDKNILVELLRPADSGLTEMIVVHYVLMAHLVGGLFLISGFLTRIASLIQIPILLGAIIINFQNETTDQLIISVLIFTFLLFFTVIGSGKYAVDYNMKLEI